MDDESRKGRVFAAANELYKERGCSSFPTVDEVRARAGVDSNAAARLMREWRRERREARPSPLEDVPDELLALSADEARTMWNAARRLARRELDAERAGWEAERADATVVLAEVSAACDAKIAELQASDRRSAALQAALAESEAKVVELQERLASALERARSSEEHCAKVVSALNDVNGQRDELRAGFEAAKAKAEAAESQSAALRDQVLAEQRRTSFKLDDLISISREARKETPLSGKARMRSTKAANLGTSADSAGELDLGET